MGDQFFNDTFDNFSFSTSGRCNERAPEQQNVVNIGWALNHNEVDTVSFDDSVFLSDSFSFTSFTNNTESEFTNLNVDTKVKSLEIHSKLDEKVPPSKHIVPNTDKRRLTSRLNVTVNKGSPARRVSDCKNEIINTPDNGASINFVSKTLVTKTNINASHQPVGVLREKNNEERVNTHSSNVDNKSNDPFKIYTKKEQDAEVNTPKKNVANKRNYPFNTNTKHEQDDEVTTPKKRLLRDYKVVSTVEKPKTEDKNMSNDRMVTNAETSRSGVVIQADIPKSKLVRKMSNDKIVATDETRRSEVVKTDTKMLKILTNTSNLKLGIKSETPIAHIANESKTGVHLEVETNTKLTKVENSNIKVVNTVETAKITKADTRKAFTNIATHKIINTETPKSKVATNIVPTKITKSDSPEAKLTTNISTRKTNQLPSSISRITDRYKTLNLELTNKEQTIPTNKPSPEEPHISPRNESHKLSTLGLPEMILQKYESRNVIYMFPWQVECLNKPNVLENHKNLVYSAPTSAGKTLVAEILAIKTVMEREKKVLFILPYVSVVREKMFYFQDILGTSGVRVEGFMGCYNPPGGFRSVQVAICTIEKANSLVNRLLEEDKLSEIGAVVVDEMHLLGDPGRGYLLELLLTKLRYMSLKNETVNIQIIGMSATLPNLGLLAEWLDAELYTTTFRPIPLLEQCQISSEIFGSNMELIRKVPVLAELDTDTDNILQLCLETINSGCSVLIFCPTKNWCENLAQQIAMAFWKLGRSKGDLGRALRKQLSEELVKECMEQLKRCPVGLDQILGRTVCLGVAFHHAGLTMDERDIVEGGFRGGSIRVLIATSTLSSGVNLPARRVIIRSPTFHGKPIDTLVYRQMIGRAGRMGRDVAGESILICQKADVKTARVLMSANLQPIESCLEGAGKLKRAILEVVTSNVASTPDEIDLFTKCTLLACGASEDDALGNPITESLDFLISNEFVRLQQAPNGESKYVATSLAKACLSSSLPPEEGLALFAELEKARQCFVLETELHLLYLVTPYTACNQLGTIDWFLYLDMWDKLSASMKRVGDLVGVTISYLINATRGQLQTNTSKLYHKLQVHKRFYTALILQDLVNEIPLGTVAAKYNCNRGMLQSLQQSAATFAAMVTSFSKQLGWSSVEILVSQFQDRLQFGVSRDLIDLMRLPILNGQRARTLFNAGIEGVVDLAGCDICDLENILHKSRPFESEKERDGENEHDTKKRNTLRTIWVTGKQGLTERQAAEMLVKDARQFLKYEMGLSDAKWDDNGGKKIDDNSDESVESVVKGECVNNSDDTSNSSDANQCIGSDAKPSEENNVATSRDVVGEIFTKHNSAKIIDVSNKSEEKQKTSPEANKRNEFALLRNIDPNEVQSNNPDPYLSKHKQRDIKSKLAISDLTTPQTLPSRTSPNQKEDFKSSIAVNHENPTTTQQNQIVALANQLELSTTSTTTNYTPTSSEFKSPGNPSRYSLRSRSSLNQSVDLNRAGSFDLSDNSTDCLFAEFKSPMEANRNLSRSRSSLNATTNSLDLSKSLNSSIQSNTSSGYNLRSSRNTLNATTNSLNISNSSEPTRKNKFRSHHRRSSSINRSRSDLSKSNRSCYNLRSSQENINISNQSLFNDSFNMDSKIMHNISDLERKSDDSSLAIRLFTEKSPLPTHDTSTTKQSLKVYRSSSGNSSPTKESSLVTFSSTEDLLLAEAFTSSFNDLNQQPNKSVANPDKNSPPSVNSLAEAFTESFNDSHKPPNKTMSTHHKHILLQDSLVEAYTDSFNDLNQQVSTDHCDMSRKRTRISDSIINSEDDMVVIQSPVKKTKISKGRKQRVNSIIVDSTFIISGNRTIRTDVDRDSIQEIESPSVISDVEIVNVCEDKKSFENFRRNIREKKALSLAVACEEVVVVKAVIGGRKPSTSDSVENCCFKNRAVRGVAVSWGGNTAYYMGLQSPNIGQCEVINLLNSVLSNKDLELQMYDVKQQVKVLKQCCGVDVDCTCGDPKVAEWLLDSDGSEKSLHAMIAAHAPEVLNLCNIAGSSRGSPGLDLKSSKDARIRASVECVISWHLIGALKSVLGKHDPNLLHTYGIEMKCVTILSKMEQTGFGIDLKVLQKLADDFKAYTNAVESKAYQLAGRRFSFSSPKEVAKILGMYKGATRRRVSTSKQVLEQSTHPISNLIIQWRKLNSTLTKMVYPMLRLVENGRIYGTCITHNATGRISMHEPNMQNVPRDFEFVNPVNNNTTNISCRMAFMAHDKNVLVSADYCQLELRLLAHLSQDSILCGIMRNNEDVFRSISAKWNNIKEEEVTDTIRQQTKQICYGIIYGMGNKTLSEHLSVTEEEAIEFVETFHRKYPAIKKYISELITKCRENGYVETIAGRRRYLEHINHTNPAVKSQAERQAVNTTIQGSAADIAKNAMVLVELRIEEKFRSSRNKPKLVLQLHDELVYEVPEKYLSYFGRILTKCMQGSVQLSVPFPVKLKSGRSWGSMKEHSL